MRKVRLRGRKNIVEAEGLSVLEEKQYEDIWANDTYLQYMYERLILMKELLSEQGSIYLHCDNHKYHHLRFLMDEVFGVNNFLNEIAYNTSSNISGFKAQANNWIRQLEHILWYAKKGPIIFNKQFVSSKNDKNVKVPVGNIWNDIHTFQFSYVAARESVGYPTQKPEALLERIIKASSHPDSIVMDGFCGSGTTAAVAEKLGRRWIMADMNRGAIQTTMKRLQCIQEANKQQNLQENKPRYGFATYRINNYDFKDQNQLREVIISRYGIELSRSDSFFDGTRNGNLVKIAELNRPLLINDINAIKEEIDSRPDEKRDITLIGNGVESATYKYKEREVPDKITPINKIHIIDFQKGGG